MKADLNLPTPLIRWTEALQARLGTDLTHLLLRLLPIWGFVGGQILWMVAPLLGQEKVEPIARALEDPQALEALKTHITKGVNG